MDQSLDDYMQYRRPNFSQGGRQNFRGRGRGRGGQKFSGNKQQGVKNFQFKSPQNTGNIASRLGMKISPVKRVQQYKVAMRIAANKQKTGATRVTGNQQGLTTKGKAGIYTAKFDARQKILEKKQKITDAREKIQQKAQPADARLKIQNKLAKKTNASKKFPLKMKNITNAPIPKVVFQNTQAHKQKKEVTMVNTVGGSLVRTVDNRPPGLQGIPMKTVKNHLSTRPSTNVTEDFLLTRTLSQQVEPKRGAGRRRQGRGRGGRPQITMVTHQDEEMEDPLPLTRTVPNQQRSIARGSMLITTKGVPQRQQPRQFQAPAPSLYMEQEESYSSGPLVLSSGDVQRQPPPYVRITSQQYKQPLQQSILRPIKRSPPPPPKAKQRLGPAVDDRMEDSEEVVISPLQGFKVMVTNLHPIVTQDDIIELFGAIGALKRARILKKGIAEVVFVNKNDALAAVKKYHNRELDSQPMQLKLVTPIPTKEAPVFRLPGKPANSDGPKGRFDLDMSVLQKALFKTTAARDPSAPPARPVTFTVKI